MISVCMITYNQEKYIKQAVLGVVEQITSSPIELLISDDNSTDSTQKIIRNLSTKYPNIIRAFYNKKNLGIMKNFAKIYMKCKGDYVALCEGDDYWNDTNKLQKQTNFLEKNDDYSISTHNVFVKDQLTKKTHEWLGKNHRRTSTINDILKYGSGGATCSIVYKRKFLKQLPSWLSTLPSGDWPMQILLSSKGKMIYFKEPMATYRRNAGGATSVTSFEDLIKIYDEGGVKLCEFFDKLFDYKYHEAIQYNLNTYFYPQLYNAYKLNNDKKHMSFYADLMLKQTSDLTFRKRLEYGYYRSVYK